MRSFAAAAGFGPPRIWAVAGGKGGVGKSVVATNLAVALAERGGRCALVDLDLGGANLHTLLGVTRPRRTLSHFLGGSVAALEDVLGPTSVPGVGLVSGSGALLEIANLRHSQKLKLLRHVRRLPVTHVVLDLGAGSAFNVLDFFLAADAGLLVVVPEPTAVENAYHFLKAAFFRSLRGVARRDDVRPALEAALASGRRRGASPRQLVREAGRVDAMAGRLLEDRLRHFAPGLVVNQVDREEHRRLGIEMSAACVEHLGAAVGYLGNLASDAAVADAVRRQLPVLQLYPGCAFAGGLRRVADRLLAGTLADPAPPPAWRAPRGPLPMACHGLDGRPRQAAPAPIARRRPVRVLAPVARLADEAPGSYLRRCRERLGLSLADLEERTRLRSLERIEQERFAELPPAPYLEGHVRQYARELGITDAEALAASFLERSRHAPRRT